MAVGPQETASMRYLQCIPGVFAVNRLEDVESILSMIIHDSSILTHNAKMIREFAEHNHDVSSISKDIEQMFDTVVFGE